MVIDQLLRTIVEKRSGQPFILFVEQQLLNPLGMKDLTPYSFAKLLAGRNVLLNKKILREMEEAHVPAREVVEERRLFSGRGDFRSAGLGWHLVRVGNTKIAGRRDKGVVAAVIDDVAIVIVAKGNDPTFANDIGEQLVWVK
jgi:CubicO group peptidase (beta-lactamase class C family)